MITLRINGNVVNTTTYVVTIMWRVLIFTLAGGVFAGTGLVSFGQACGLMAAYFLFRLGSTLLLEFKD